MPGSVSGTRTIRTTITQPSKTSSKSKTKRVTKKVAKTQTRPSQNKPAVHLFRRAFADSLQLSNVSTPANWVANNNGIYRNWEFKFNDVTDSTDFSNLFAQYKLCGVKHEIYFSNSMSSPGENAEMLLEWDVNRSGTALVGSPEYFLHSQTSKKRVLHGKKVTLYTRLGQLSNMYKLTDDDYAIVKPRYISTTEPNTPHYGLIMRISRIDEQPFGTEIDQFQYVKIFSTLYFSCKKVQ